MAQQTRVLTLDATTAVALHARLRDALPQDAEWRRVAHARFAVKALGVVVTCYTSGKLVVQGSDLDTFAARFLDGLDASAAGAIASDDPELPFDVACAASDEAGKGDYFGPLVVAAVRAEPAQRAALVEVGVADSKTLSDDRARLLAGRIEALLPYEVVALDPPEYNRRHADVRNVNLLLADLHAEALDRLTARCAATDLAIVDRFADEALVRDALARRGRRFARLVQVPRAERHAAVAAASILARVAFLDGLRRCEEDCGSDLHKGAGPPVDVAARRVVAIGGRALLARVAKLHFKNSERVLA
ncbi:MAG: ribonuclease HIII [Planctomycetes bacterium]|nr:ribonuclease HIII [Planctomycetota bacterium]